MLIRNIKDCELEKAREICYKVFEFNIDGEENPSESAKMIRNNPTTRMKKQYLNTLGAYDKSGEMTACLWHCTAPVNFDGSTAYVTEIGDVAATPACQGKGIMKSMFSKVLNSAYKNGVQFSYLYPFSGTYYHQFGYSYCVQNNIWKIALAQLPNYNTSGTIVEYSPARLKDVISIYEKFTKQRNLSIIREDIEWYHAIGRYNIYRDHIFTYIYYDKKNIPLGYLIYTNQTDINGFTTINCKEFLYINKEGLLGLLDFLRKKKAYRDFASITLPADIDLTYIIPEHDLHAQKGTSVQHKTYGMVRVVNVAKALALAKPQNNGQVRLQLIDKYLPQNDGIWQLIWENNKFTTIKYLGKADKSETDITLDISLFSRLLCSGILESNLLLLSKYTFTCSVETFCNLFPIKNVGIFEYF